VIRIFEVLMTLLYILSGKLMLHLSVACVTKTEKNVL
jgi:hypothetical protein